MQVRLQRWAKAEPPTESELRERLHREGLSPTLWWNDPGDVYPEHTHGYDKVVYVVRGSIRWVLTETGQEIEAHAGDRLELPRGTRHAAYVGPDGVTCLEAHR